MAGIPPIAPAMPERISPTRAPEQVTSDLDPGLQNADLGGGFAKAIGDALDTISGLESKVDAASQQAATGDLDSVSDYMIATSEAQLATEITVAIRDRAIAAFNDIMRMQI